MTRCEFNFSDQSGKSVFLWQSGKIRYLQRHSVASRFMCAAFHPTNENLVYFFGGYYSDGGDHAFSLDLDSEEYENLKSLPYIVWAHSCVGFVKKNGNPVSFLTTLCIPGIRWRIFYFISFSLRLS